MSEIPENTLVLTFAGYFQMRMATDPDPTDDPRGMSGYTFALPGEPDFDGILHFQASEDGVHERSFGADPFAPRVGVKVVSAIRRGNPVPGLVGAAFSLPDARLVERNGLVVRNDYFAIDPVLVRLVQNGQLLLERFDELDPNNPGLPIVKADTPELLRRQPTNWKTKSEEVAKATGLPQPVTYEDLIKNRLNRQSYLSALLEQTTDPVARAALEVRIRELSIVRKWWDLSEKDPDSLVDRRAYTLALQALGWNIGINGKVQADLLGADESVPWPLAFWMGGWDGDALCGYISGSLTVPLKSSS